MMNVQKMSEKERERFWLLDSCRLQFYNSL